MDDTTWADPPTHPDPSDCELLLDDGASLSAHALYLRHASPIFCNALNCARPALPDPPHQPQ